MSCGIILKGNPTDSKKKVLHPKKIVRIMAGTKRRVSCRELLMKFNVPLSRKFLHTLLSSVVYNMEKFQTNSDIHSISTRYRYAFMF
jgi:hypothetical protein